MSEIILSTFHKVTLVSESSTEGVERAEMAVQIQKGELLIDKPEISVRYQAPDSRIRTHHPAY